MVTMNIAETLELLAKKGWIQEVEISTILEDEDFQKLSTKKGKKKKTTEERAGIINPLKCDARIWNDGYDNIQCDFTKVNGECLCSRHLTKFNENGGWWLGMITEPRPEKPIWKNKDGKEVEHFWRTDKDGNEINLDKKTSQKKEGVEKKKRGRPKGSKNKKKKVNKHDLTKEEILLLLEEKKKEKELKDVKTSEEDKGKEEDDEGEVIYSVDNVPYEIKDNEIMDPEDYSPIGQADGKGGINFEDEEAEERHQLNIKKYNK